MEFQERFKWHTFYSTGATVVTAPAAITPFYPMQGYRRADFLFTGIAKLDSSGALGGTDYQKFTIKLVEASNSTGGGSAALSSATAIVGKDSATGVSTSMKMREGLIFFSTIADDATLELTVNGVTYTGATSGSAAMYFTCAASAAATVACQGFVTMFNSTTNNTATAVTANWYAATMAAAVPWVRILPKDIDGTHLLTLGATGSSQIGIGGVFQAHLGVDVQHMTDGKTHIGLKAYSTENANPFCVQVIRESEFQPVKSVTYSKTMGQSTSK